MWTNRNNTILVALFALFALTSCIDDDLLCLEEEEEIEVPEDIANGYSLSFIVTLDKMGGSTRAANTPKLQELAEMEDYIDPEKFRVLFFDNDDKFLFESKSRWVKQLTYTDDDYSRWFVSVPVFSYGNDTEYNWNWKLIRDKLVNNKFKIAILANRPEIVVFPDLDEVMGGQKSFDNTGPHWKNTDTGVKDVFNLHHSQWDPIYESKNAGSGYYDFILTYEYDEKRREDVPFMSSTSSWVSWGNNNQDNDKKLFYVKELENEKEKDQKWWRYSIHPSKDHPIPMYGIQEFAALTKSWKEGTTFNLMREGDKSISLLRSVVRLELQIPKLEKYPAPPKHITLWFSNIYARCEPMDVWTPTDQIWGNSLEDHIGNHCEIESILNYGPIATYLTGSNDIPNNAYQERLSWLYGSWKEKNWDFNKDERRNVTLAEETPDTPYPHIFNPCIQRNNVIWCDRTLIDDDPDYYHYVVYTGERNVNDPTDLSDISKQGNLAYWAYSFDDTNDNNSPDNFYYIPITDYNNPNNPAIANSVIGPHTLHANKGETDFTSNYMETIKQSAGHSLPYPLVRNHIYKMTLTSKDDIIYSYIWNFRKELTSPSVDGLNTDNNWSNAKGLETKYLSNNSGILSSNNNGSAVVQWGWSGLTGATTLTKNSTSQFVSGNQINIDGSPYYTIQTGSGQNDRTTTLTLPQEKVIKKLTLHSYVNKTLSYTTLINYPTPNTNGNGFKSYDTSTSGVYEDGNRWRFGGSYNNSNPGRYLEISYNGGFKAGDRITISGETPDGVTIDLFTFSGTARITFKKNDFYTSTTQSYTLTEDCDVLCLCRNGSGTSYVNTIKVERPEKVAPIHYWSNVNNQDRNYDDTGMRAFASSDRNIYDTYEFKITPASRTVSFTSSNSGDPVCYVAAVDVENADGTPDYWEYKNTLNGTLQANSKALSEFEGLQFNDGKIRIYKGDVEGESRRIRLTGRTTITFPDLPGGHTISITGKSASNNNCSIQPIQAYLRGSSADSEFSGNEVTYTWTVNGDSKTLYGVQFLLVANDGVDFYEFRIDPPTRSRAAQDTEKVQNFSIKSEDLHSKSLNFSFPKIKLK